MADGYPVAAPGVGSGAGDLAELAARFGAALRRAGLPVGPGRTERFAAAVTLVRPASRQELFNCALATLVSARDQADTLEAVFAEVFGSLDGATELTDLSMVPGLGRPPQPAHIAEAAMLARMHADTLAVSQDGADQGEDGA
ncbi:MAG TPA: hypothetical protein VGH53_17800, partial [Streptosporangiaceae bacterium]